MGIFQILSGMRLSLSPLYPPMLVGMKKETVKYHTSFSIDNDLQIQGQDHHRGLESSLTTAGTYIICKTGIRQICDTIFSASPAGVRNLPTAGTKYYLHKPPFHNIWHHISSSSGCVDVSGDKSADRYNLHTPLVKIYYIVFSAVYQAGHRDHWAEAPSLSGSIIVEIVS